LHVTDILAIACGAPILGGTVFSLLCWRSVRQFVRRSLPQNDYTPPVTVLKPVRGLEKDLKANLKTIAEQDYPLYQAIYSVQDPNDPALPLLYEIQQEIGSNRVAVVVASVMAGANGKVNNLLGAIAEARYETLVISDSDTCLRPDYLKTIVAPLADPKVGCVCTPFKLIRGDRWYEKLELLTINADFIPSVIFAEVTGASKACLGPSIAIRRSTLDELGGLASLADYLVEDFELGRRVWTNDLEMVLLPYLINAVVDLKNWQSWWSHQVYWDQNTYLARPAPFVATILVRAIPFALFLLLLQGGSLLGWGILAVTILVRYLTANRIAKLLQDKEGQKCLYLLLIRDVIALIFWLLAFTQRTVTWRGVKFKLIENGKMVPSDL
jgi:ceramide glucosyltransferase